MAGEDGGIDMSALKSELPGSEDGKKGLNTLWRRIRTTAALMAHLKVKARFLAVHHLDLSSLDDSDEEAWMKLSDPSSGDQEAEEEAAYMTKLLSCVQTVSDVMESLVQRVIMAESETAIERKKVTFGEEEIRKKVVQIENMAVKLEEMERFALGTNGVLAEMRQRVEELVEETSRQRQRAAENEDELCRVKRDFESLKSYVGGLVSVRETLLSSEKQFQTIERLFERLVEKTGQLESEKMQKEAEVRKVMEENVRLTALLDKKEAQLLALNQQCKLMALTASNPF